MAQRLCMGLARALWQVLHHLNTSTLVLGLSSLVSLVLPRTGIGLDFFSLATMTSNSARFASTRCCPHSPTSLDLLPQYTWGMTDCMFCCWFFLLLHLCHELPCHVSDGLLQFCPYQCNGPYHCHPISY